MTIAFEAALAPAAQFVGSSGTVTTGALNSSANSDRVVLLMVVSATSNSGNSIDAARYGGVTMTADTERDVSLEYSGFSRARFFYLTGAPSGSNTFQIDYTNPTSVHLGYAAVAYSGATGGVSAITYPTNTGTSGTALTLTQTSSVGETALAVFFYPADQRANPGTGVTERVDGLGDANSGEFYIAEKAGASSVTIDATAAGTSGGWRGLGITLLPGGGGGGSITFDEEGWNPMEPQTNPLTVSVWG